MGAKGSSGLTNHVETYFTRSYNPWDQRLGLVPNSDLLVGDLVGKALVVILTGSNGSPKR